MEVLFENRDLANSRKRKGKFSHVSKQIERRIEQLLTADNLETLEKNYPGWRCHEYSGKEKGTFTINLSGNWRLRFRPTLEPSYLPNGRIDKTKILSITIVEILDPH